MLSIEKGGEEFKFWAELFQFRKKFYEPPKGNKEAEEKFWTEIMSESNALVEKYKDADFNQFGIVKKQVLDVVFDLEAKYKNAPSQLKAS